MKPVREREARFAGICGIAAAVIGLANLICGSILIDYKVENGDGLWSGLGMIATGAIGVAIWWTRYRPAMMVFLMLSSVLAIALVIQVALAVIGFIFWKNFTERSKNCYVYYGVCRCTTSDGEKLPIPLKSCDLIKMFDDVYLVLIFFSILSFIVMSAASFVGCISTCFEDIQKPEREMTMPTQPTDLDPEEIHQSQEPTSPKQAKASSQDENTGKNDLKETEVQEKDEKKTDEEKKEDENVYEVIVEKTP